MGSEHGGRLASRRSELPTRAAVLVEVVVVVARLASRPCISGLRPLRTQVPAKIAETVTEPLRELRLATQKTKPPPTPILADSQRRRRRIGVPVIL